MEDFRFKISEKLHLISKTCKEKVKKTIAEPPPEKRFDSIYVQRQKAELEAEEAIEIFKTTVEKGFQILLKTLKEQNKEEESTRLKNWFGDHEKEIYIALSQNDSEETTASIEKTLNFPRALLNHMYEAVLLLMNHEEWEEAQAAILVCLQFNPSLPMLWLSYGDILQNQEDHESALYLYHFALMLDESNPLIFAHRARSWILLGNYEQADEDLTKAVSICETLNSMAGIKIQCENLKEWIKQSI